MEVLGVKLNFLLLLPELILVATGTVILLADLWLKQKRQMAYVALAGVVAALVAIWPAAADPTLVGKEFWGRMLVADSLTFFLKAVILMIAGLVILFSVDFVEKRLSRWFSEFYEILLFATIGMMIMVSSRDLITIYLGLETAAISSYVLAALLRRDARSNEAGLKYFLNGALASAVLLYGLSLLYGLTGATHLEDIARALSAGTHPAPLLAVAIVFVAGGFAFKVAAAPFHLWAPDVYQGAPTPVTGFFSVGPKGAAFAALLRVFMVGLGGFTAQWVLIITVLAVLSMFIGNLTALMQTDVKRMMAYSSIAHAGYMLVGVAAASALGTGAVLFYILAYAITNLGVFAVITAVDNEKGSTELADFKGLATRNPLYAWSLVIFFLSLIGIPITAGFFGKLFIIQATIAADMVWLALLIAVNSAISVGYYYAIVRTMFFEAADAAAPAFRPGAGIAAAVILTVVGTVLVGILAGPFATWSGVAAGL